jgi:hypothetical protein
MSSLKLTKGNWGYFFIIVIIAIFSLIMTIANFQVWKMPIKDIAKECATSTDNPLCMTALSLSDPRMLQMLWCGWLFMTILSWLFILMPIIEMCLEKK